MPKIKEITRFSILFKAFSVLSPLFRGRDQKLLKRYGNKQPDLPLVFIIGSPRSGSTLLYQLITNQYKILYPDNLVHLFNKNFQVGVGASRKIYGDKPHNCFTSVAGLGKTFHSPSEYGSFWYQWIDRENHHVLPGDLTEDSKKAIQSNINAVMNRFGKPLVMKNLFLVERLQLLLELFPEAKFIWIQRDVVQTGQSIYKMRKQLGIPPVDWWSVRPENYLDYNDKGLPEKIIGQVTGINRQIKKELAGLSDDRLLQVEYKDVCTDTEEILTKIATFISPDLELKPNAKTPSLTYNEKVKIDPEIFQSLKDEWDNNHDITA